MSAFQSDLVVDNECEGKLALPANSAMFAALDGAVEAAGAEELEAAGVAAAADVAGDSCAALAFLDLPPRRRRCP